MMTPLITLVVLVVITLLTAAGTVALATTNHERGRRALTMLKVLLGTSGVFGVLTRLHEAGLL